MKTNLLVVLLLSASCASNSENNYFVTLDKSRIETAYQAASFRVFTLLCFSGSRSDFLVSSLNIMAFLSMKRLKVEKEEKWLSGRISFSATAIAVSCP